MTGNVTINGQRLERVRRGVWWVSRQITQMQGGRPKSFQGKMPELCQDWVIRVGEGDSGGGGGVEAFDGQAVRVVSWVISSVFEAGHLVPTLWRRAALGSKWQSQCPPRPPAPSTAVHYLFSPYTQSQLPLSFGCRFLWHHRVETGQVVQWVERRISNPNTLDSIARRARVRHTLFMLVKDVILFCHKRVGITAGGIQTRKQCTQEQNKEHHGQAILL